MTHYTLLEADSVLVVWEVFKVEVLNKNEREWMVMAKMPVKIEEKRTLIQTIEGEWDFSNVPEGSILIEMENLGKVDATSFFKKLNGKYGKITFKEEDKIEMPVNVEGDIIVV